MYANADSLIHYLITWEKKQKLSYSSDTISKLSQKNDTVDISRFFFTPSLEEFINGYFIGCIEANKVNILDKRINSLVKKIHTKKISKTVSTDSCTYYFYNFYLPNDSKEFLVTPAGINRTVKFI